MADRRRRIQSVYNLRWEKQNDKRVEMLPNLLPSRFANNTLSEYKIPW